MIKYLHALLLAGAALALPLHAAPSKAGSAQAAVKLKDGATDVKVGDMTVRIIRGFAGNLTASGFSTYTVYVLPSKPGERWLHVTTPAEKGIGYNFRSYETGDANIQSIAFYKKGDALYAVQAAKVGLPAPQINLASTEVEFRTYKFNQDWDVPMFDDEATTRSKGKYTDAAGALAKEFFNSKD